MFKDQLKMDIKTELASQLMLSPLKLQKRARGEECEG